MTPLPVWENLKFVRIACPKKEPFAPMWLIFGKNIIPRQPETYKKLLITSEQVEKRQIVGYLRDFLHKPVEETIRRKKQKLFRIAFEK